MKKAFIPAALIFSASVAFAGVHMFEELDTDQDGSLSQEEAAAAEGLDFDAADTDMDGSVSQEEFKTAMEGTEGEHVEEVEGTEKAE